MLGRLIWAYVALQKIYYYKFVLTLTIDYNAIAVFVAILEKKYSGNTFLNKDSICNFIQEAKRARVNNLE